MAIRRVLLLLIGGAAVFLVPWTAYLADTLPAEHNTNQWRLAWVGFDIALVCCFAVATWLGLSRRRRAVPLLAGTAALLCCDAWFDVVLDWTEPDRWTSVAMAVLVEVPIAILLGLRSRLLLTGGMPSRGLTLQDIEIHADASYQRLLRNLGTFGSCDAANHRDEFGSWGKGERAVTHLTVTELASFNAEYNELLIRYCLLHARPTAGTREVAIRFYAFHFPEHPINDVPDKTRIQPHPAH